MKFHISPRAYLEIIPCMSPASISLKGPSIYDVHTEGEGVRLRWTHVGGGGGSSAMWTSTQKIKILSPLTSYCLLIVQRSWRLFYQNFIFGQKKWKFFCDIN